MIIVLLLLGCVATASIWAYFTRSEVTLVNAAELLIEDLYIAQSRALYLRTPVEVVFDADGAGYRVSDGTGSTSSGLSGLDLIGRRYDVDAVFEGVTIAAVDGGEPAGKALRIDAKGALLRSAFVTLAYRGETRTVQVDAEVGSFFLADAAHR